MLRSRICSQLELFGPISRYGNMIKIVTLEKNLFSNHDFLYKITPSLWYKEPESGFVISAPATGGILISVPHCKIWKLYFQTHATFFVVKDILF